MRTLLTDKTPSGQDAVWTTSDGVLHEFFQFNDRGRGPKFYNTSRIDSKGLLVSSDLQGVDYMKAPIQEHFAFDGTNASWKNQSENGQLSNAAGKFYIELNGGPEQSAVLARALLAAPDHTLALLPSGTATLRKDQSVTLQGNSRTATATLYEINGLSFTPAYLWLDDRMQLIGSIQGWSALVQPGFESAIGTLRDSQRQTESTRAAELAKKFTHHYADGVIFHNANVLDTISGIVVTNQRVVINGDRIASIGLEHEQPYPENAAVIDATGKTLIPGLWDMHAHIDATGAFLDIAAGVTTVRDLGNSIDELSKLTDQIKDGAQIGPRVIKAGFIDGPGPFEAPIKVLASTPAEARQRVDHYADLGYVQIKIYSSVKPELVPVIIDEAHKRKMRVSGHVPAGMFADQFIKAGADEIQHMNFLFLNFMPDVKETRTPARFIEPGRRGLNLDLSSAPVSDFIELLRRRQTVIDPTMETFENTYVDRPGLPTAADADMYTRLPVQVQREVKSGGGALGAKDPETDRLYRASYTNMLHLLGRLSNTGIQIVAGTDTSGGYGIYRELELYAEAGIPAPQILGIATIQAAQVMHMDDLFGSITPGKYADVILIDGDPARNISDIRRVEVVVKNGDLYRPSEMYPAFGIAPR